jgi:hypothetical protein
VAIVALAIDVVAIAGANIVVKANLILGRAVRISRSEDAPTTLAFDKRYS